MSNNIMNFNNKHKKNNKKVVKIVKKQKIEVIFFKNIKI